MLISTAVLLFFLFLVYALFLLASRKSEARGVLLQQRVAEALQGLKSPDEAIQISREDSIGGVPVINRLLSSVNFIRDLEWSIKQADMQITVSRLLMICFAAAVMAGLAAYTMTNAVVAIVLALVAGGPVRRRPERPHR